MKQDEIMEMAKQAGFSGSVAKMWTEYFETFAKLVEDFATAKEREGLVRIIEANIADEPVAQWQKRHLLRTDGKWENTNEHDAKWWRLGHTQGWEIRALYTTPQQRKPPTT